MNKEYYWLNKDAITFLERGYLSEGESPEQRFQVIAKTAETILGISGFADKFLSYFKRGFYSLSTPVITNFGNSRGLPVSCFGSWIPDTMDGILSKASEIGIMSKMGGGTSAFFGELRPRGAKISVGGESSGPVHFMQIFNTVANIISQGSARRGSFAAYLPVEHPDIEEFIKLRSEGSPIQDTHLAVTVTDKWLTEMENGDKDKRKIWAKIIQKRFETGYPYIEFIDNVNNNAPQVYRDKKMLIKASNLCNEVQLFSDINNSFVCVLSSYNLLHWDEIKETDAIETLIYFLDAVNEEFINKTRHMKFMESAHNFAKTQRALGAGVLGWHSYLQSKMIAFESMEAKILNVQIHKTLKEKTDKANKDLAVLLGEPDLLKSYGLRNVTTLAIAPTTSSSFILGQISPSIEPLNSNYFVKDLARGKFTYQNPYLREILSKHGKDDDKTWKSILIKGGSVQHLSFLSENEKNVFKTFGEISQKEIIIQAAARQRFIDQGQSLNLMIPPETSAKDVNELILFAWKQGIKGLYYQRGSNPSQKLARDILACKSCEG